MNEGSKQAYLDKTAAQLKEWSARVEIVKAQIAQGTADVRIDFHKKMEKWQKNESAFKQKMEDLRSAGEDGFETMKAGAQNVWNEMSSFVESLEDKKNEIRK